MSDSRCFKGFRTGQARITLTTDSNILNSVDELLDKALNCKLKRSKRNALLMQMRISGCFAVSLLQRHSSVRVIFTEA